MSKLPTDARLVYEPKTIAGPVHYECQRCGRRTKTYRKITRHRRRCATNGRLGARPEG
jgi:hypothetical protein